MPMCVRRKDGRVVKASAGLHRGGVGVGGEVGAVALAVAVAALLDGDK